MILFNKYVLHRLHMVYNIELLKVRLKTFHFLSGKRVLQRKYQINFCNLCSVYKSYIAIGRTMFESCFVQEYLHLDICIYIYVIFLCCQRICIMHAGVNQASLRRHYIVNYTLLMNEGDRNWICTNAPVADLEVRNTFPFNNTYY